MPRIREEDQKLVVSLNRAEVAIIVDKCLPSLRSQARQDRPKMSRSEAALLDEVINPLAKRKGVNELLNPATKAFIE